MRRVLSPSRAGQSRTQETGSSNSHLVLADLQSLKVELESNFERMFEQFAVELDGKLQRTMREVLREEQHANPVESGPLNRKNMKRDKGHHVHPTMDGDESDWIRPLKTYVAGRLPAKKNEFVRGVSGSSDGGQSDATLLEGPWGGASTNSVIFTEPLDPRSVNNVKSDTVKAMERFMGTLTYELFLVAMIMLSAVMLGVETQMSDDYYSATPLLVGEFVLCVVFALDITARLLVQRCYFFTHPDWAWHLFDLVIVGCQIFEQVLVVVELVYKTSTRSCSIRFVAFLRVIRLFRIVRFFQELRSILVSIFKSLQSLGWTLVMLILVLYVFSICFRQAVQASFAADMPEELSYWYGSVFRTMLTLFESMMGGVSWDEAIVPLVSHISPLWGAAFVLYIIISLFVLQNLVAAYFVVNLTRTVQDERDTTLASHIKDTFFEQDGQEKRIEFEEFSHKLKAIEMQDYFKAIDLDPAEDRILFDLLDTGNEGSLTPDEVIDGCLRLRGAAKALDLSRWMKRLDARLTRIESNCAAVCD